MATAMTACFLPLSACSDVVTHGEAMTQKEAGTQVEVSHAKNDAAAAPSVARDAGRTPPDITHADEEAEPGESWPSALAVDASAKRADAAPASVADAALPAVVVDAGLAETVDAAAPTVAHGAGSCANDLSNIGNGPFRIAFTLTTTQVGHASILAQRGICDYSPFWNVHAFFPAEDGAAPTAAALIMESDDDTRATNHSVAEAPVTLNDGEPHQVVITRLNGRLTVDVDGSETTADARAAFGPLAPLSRGTDVCMPVDNRVAFNGTLADLCISH